MVKLVYNDQQGRERAIEIGPQRNMITIGRNPDCHIQTNNASVSRIHAMVTWQDGRVYVQDPPSGRPTNGTYVDGMRLQAGELLELCANSEFKCGNFSLRVLDDESGMVSPMGAQAQPPSPARPLSQPPQSLGPPTGGHNPNYGVGYSTYGAQPSPGHSPPMGVSSASSPPSASNYVQPAAVKHGGPPYTPSKHGQYPPQHGRGRPTAAPVPANLQPVMGVNPEEHNRLIDEFNALRRELEDARNAKIASDEALREAKESLEQRERELLDFEHRTDHHDTVVDSLNDMIKHLKEQLEHQKDQLQENKREIVTLEEHNENLEYELGALKQSLESKGMATSNAETTIANLKVQLTQKNRHLTELQRELDLTQYAVKEERENVERLQHNIQELNANLEDSERHCRDMKKVVEQHEAMFGELRAGIEERNSEILRLQNTIRSGGGDGGALLSENTQLREDLLRANKESDSLREQLKSAEALIATSASGQSEAGLDSLRERLQDLEQIHAELIKERDELKQKLDDEPMRVGDDSHAISPELANQLKRVYESTNDSVSQWRDNLLSIEDHIHSLQRVFRYFMRIDFSILPPNDRSRIEASLQDYDPRIIFEEVASLLEADQNSFGDIKENLRELRSLL
ncbi:MAG: FHA domain-containing protein [Bradymonadia bacterium]